jgi:phospholipase C
MKRSLWRATTASVVAAMLQPGVLGAAPPTAPYQGPKTGPYGEPVLTPSGTHGTPGEQFASHPSQQGRLSLQQKLALLRQKVKYVFVLFQENRSFDYYFGTYPGANGLFSSYDGANPADPYATAANQLPSFNSVIQNTDGSFSTISPFLIPRTIQNHSDQTVQLYPEDTYSVDHSHAGYLNDMHADLATKSVTPNDAYPLDQEGLHYATDASGTGAPIVTSEGVAPTANPSLASKQKGEVVISHVDCDTIPFLWQYADRFTLFDNFHQTAVGPSTPNAIAMIAGQVGDTQWVQTGSVGYTHDGKSPALSVPNLADNGPFPGSGLDGVKVKPPYGPDETSTPNTDLNGDFTVGELTPNADLTFATLPLSFMGSQAKTIIAADENPTADLAEIQDDINTIAMARGVVNWGWYQQGYGPEPFDGKPLSENFPYINFGSSPAPEHASYIVHHNGPQYFGYLGDNPQVTTHLHSLQQFYTDVQNHALPAQGGVFYVRGGYYNNDNMKPADPAPAVAAATPGNDDHPNYSDAGISEALIADSVNAIANSPYWKDSAIIITYDESDGLYDHQPEQFRTYGPDGQPETGGSRIPAIVISPYAASHMISHVYSEHSSVIRFINELFNLTALADLPDEAKARAAAATNAAFNGPRGAQHNLGPADDPAALDYPAGMGDLLEAFDDARLSGKAPLLPASLATIPPALAHKLPHYAGTGRHNEPTYGCQYLGITPTDYPHGYFPGAEIDPPPQDFNPRPTQSPGNPHENTGATAGSTWPG